MAIRLLLTEFRKHTIFQFNGVLKVVFCLLVLQLFILCLQYDMQVDLFMGPLLYLYVAKPKVLSEAYSKTQFLHISFFIVLFWLSLYSKSDFFLLVQAIYLLCYSYLIHKKFNATIGYGPVRSVAIFVSFCTFYISVVGVLLLINFVENNIINLLSFNSVFLFVGMSVTAISFLFYLLCEYKNLDSIVRNQVQASVFEQDFYPDLKTDSFRAEVVDKVVLFFDTSDLYLQANFTLEDFSVLIEVPRNVLSDVMNKEMHAGFYVLLGEYRINHAKKLLLAKENFTIEALVYQCGFHSKSTFNKYFKHFVGQTPSSFRAENMPIGKIL